jgi:hypothetical protein
MPTGSHHISIRLSERAWEGLLRKANRARFVMGWLTELPGDPFAYVDNRPEWMASADNDMLEAGRMPMWSYEEPRFRHSLANKPSVFHKLYTISVHWHITNHIRPTSAALTLSRSVAVLEAIGSDLLAPAVEVPPVPFVREDNVILKRHLSEIDKLALLK